MNHIRSLYGRFFLWIMAVCFLLAGLLFVAAASIRAGNSQLSVCLILIAAAVLLLFSAILLAVLIRAAKLRNSSENSQDETRLSFLTDLLNDEHYLGYSRQELASEMLKTQAQMNSLQSQINPHFLYNTLESIRSKALLRDEEEIATMIETLARLFRYNISQRNTESSILDELENPYSELPISGQIHAEAGTGRFGRASGELYDADADAAAPCGKCDPSWTGAENQPGHDSDTRLPDSEQADPSDSG